MRRVASVAVIVVAVGLLAGVACGRGPDRVRTVFSVEGMHCDACSSSIVTTLERVEGVIEARADHEEGTAEAVYRPRSVTAEELKAEIEKLGYTVIGMETEAVND